MMKLLYTILLPLLTTQWIAVSSPCKRRWTQQERRGCAMVAVATPSSLCENALETITLNAHALQAPKTRRDDAAETQWHLNGLREVSVQTPPPTSAFARRPQGAPTALLWRCRRSHCAATATLRSSYGAHFTTPSHGAYFEHVKSARRGMET